MERHDFEVLDRFAASRFESFHPWVLNVGREGLSVSSRASHDPWTALYASLRVKLRSHPWLLCTFKALRPDELGGGL